MNNDFQEELNILLQKKQSEIGNIPKETVPIQKEYEEEDFIPSEEEAVPKYSANHEFLGDDGFDSDLAILREKQQKEEKEAVPGLEGYIRTAGHVGEAIGAGVITDVGKLYNFLAKPLGAKPVGLPKLEELKYPTVAKVTEAGAPALLPWPGEALIAAKAGLGAAKVLPKIPKIAEFSGKTIAHGLYGAGAMGTLTKIFGNENDEENVKDAMVAGALLNTVPRAVFGAVPFGLRGMVNAFKAFSKKTGRIATPEEADALVAGVGNENVLSFGDLVKSPWLRSLYHGFLKYVPFSGIGKQQEKAIASVENKAAEFINGLTEEGSDKLYKIRDSIADKIRQIAMEHYGKAKELYSSLYERAKGKLKDFVPDSIKAFRDELREEAGNVGKALSEYLSSIELKDLNALNKEASSVIVGGKEVALENLTPNARRQLMQKIGGIDLERISKYRSEFAKKAADNLGTRTGRFYNRLIESIDNDVTTAIEKSGDKGLLAEKQKATDYYKEYVVPFLKSKGISKIMGKIYPINTTKLEKTLINGENTKVLSYLPEKVKNQLTRLLFEPSKDEAEKYAIEKVLSKSKQLTDYVKDYVLTEGTKRKLNNLEKIHDVLEPAIKATKNSIFNTIHRLSALKHGAYLASAGAIGYRTHKPLLTAAIFGSAPISARILRSPKLMEAYTKGGPVPWERGLRIPFGRGARITEPLVRHSGILTALANLGSSGGQEAYSSDFGDF